MTEDDLNRIETSILLGREILDFDEIEEVFKLARLALEEKINRAENVEP